jgi:hypothetical protein
MVISDLRPDQIKVGLRVRSEFGWATITRIFTRHTDLEHYPDVNSRGATWDTCALELTRDDQYKEYCWLEEISEDEILSDGENPIYIPELLIGFP